MYTFFQGEITPEESPGKDVQKKENVNGSDPCRVTKANAFCVEVWYNKIKSIKGGFYYENE